MVAFKIWSLEIYRYGIFYLITFLIWYLFLYVISRKWLKWYPKLSEFLCRYIDDLIIYIFAWVLIWGRLGEVLIYNLDYYLSAPLKMFAIRDGGMSFVWWFVWVMLSIILFWYVHKLKFDRLLLIFDLICIVLPIGILLGRLWNYLNQELYGKVINEWSIQSDYLHVLKDLNIATIYNKIDSNLRRNNNLLEMILEWAMLIVINITFFLNKIIYTKWKPGIVTGVFCIVYSVVRSTLETFRDNPPNEYFYGLLKSQLWMIPLSILWVRLLYRKNKVN